MDEGDEFVMDIQQYDFSDIDTMNKQLQAADKEDSLKALILEAEGGPVKKRTSH